MPWSEIFRRATKFTSGELDHSSGQALLIQGQLFYSLNASRRITTLPPPPYEGHILRDTRTCDVEEFHEPLWFSPETAHISFLPLKPVFAGYPFQRLFTIPYESYSRFLRGRYSMDLNQTIKWTWVERELQWIIGQLAARYEVPEKERTLVIEKAVAGPTIFDTAREFSTSTHRTKNWFSMYMAMMSFLIAVGLSHCNESFNDQSKAPDWYTHLLDRQWKEFYVSAIRLTMGVFGPDVHRAGVFLKLTEPHRLQYSVDFFCRFSVPVWYPWSHAEINEAKKSPAVLRLKPPAHLLQEAVTFLSKEPSPSPVKHSSQHPPADETPWVKFFAEREERCCMLRQNETAHKRRQRLGRERQPGTANAMVFVWSYDKFGHWYRELQVQEDNVEILHEYEPQDKSYNATFNEWDCGPFSGFAEENSDDLYGLFETSSEDNHPPVGQMAPVAPDMLVVEPHQNFEQEHTPSTITVPQHTQPTYTYDPDAPLQVLHDVYGFIPPLAMDPQHPAQAVPEVTTSSRKLVSLLVGVDEGRLTDLLKSYSGRLAAKFALNLADSNTTPGADVFDLIAGNYRPLASSARLKTLTKIDDDLFVFNFEGDLHKWRLAVTNIVDALLVCRLPPPMSAYELAYELLTRGIPFRTLQPVVQASSWHPPLSCMIPYRQPGYVYTHDDYHLYLDDRKTLLSDPRIARAAVMEGGILWRLSAASVSFPQVLEGPSGTARLLHRGALFETPGVPGLTHMYDDVLHSTEADRLCGLVYELTCKRFAHIFPNN